MTPYYPTVQLKKFQNKKAGFTIYSIVLVIIIIKL